MSFSVNKCFSTGPNKLRSSQDYISRRKAQTLYTTTATNTKNDISNNNQVFMDASRCLASVGGYNTNTYDLLLNLTKGRYYENSQLHIKAPQSSNINYDPIQLSSCVTVDISNKHAIPLSQTHEMYEGPLLYSDLSHNQIDVSNNLYCLPYTLRKSFILDVSKQTISSYPFGKLIIEDPLLNFEFPFKFRISDL